jgi:hypothetical protein
MSEPVPASCGTPATVERKYEYHQKDGSPDYLTRGQEASAARRSVSARRLVKN